VAWVVVVVAVAAFVAAVVVGGAVVVACRARGEVSSGDVRETMFAAAGDVTARTNRAAAIETEKRTRREYRRLHGGSSGHHRSIGKLEAPDDVIERTDEAGAQMLTITPPNTPTPPASFPAPPQSLRSAADLSSPAGRLRDRHRRQRFAAYDGPVVW